MKWKPQVVVTKENGCSLRLGNRTQTVPQESVFIIKAIENSVTEDAELVRLIMKAESIDETAAAFGLAQFILDYGDFIAADTEHFIITN